MAQVKQSLSLELIIHPGETLEEILQDREMTQKELAKRTAASEKHISQIINGKKNISNNFAKKLEYALGIKAVFWMNLQTNYDQELIEYQEINGITQEELDILKPLKEIISFFKKIKVISNTVNKSELVLLLRNLLGVSNLSLIPSVEKYAAYRVQSPSRVNLYVLFAWEKLCEIETKEVEAERILDLNILRNSIPDIKEMMNEEPGIIVNKLQEIFSECGISFNVVHNFRGAPVQGFIKKTSEGRLLLCMTIRQGFADIFWFSLFHEIGHILNGDIKHKFIDFDDYESEQEKKADYYARNTLIPDSLFNEFCEEADFSEDTIIKFAKDCGVPPFIVVGRLQKEEHLEWNKYIHLKPRYKWSD